MKKRLLSTLLALCMVLTLLPGTALAAETSGTCGNNLIWTLENGTLTIQGEGRMDDYFDWSSRADEMPPWRDYREQIHTLKINNGVTSIGQSAFRECSNLTSVTISDSVTSIGQNAFYYCDSLISVTIPANVTSIGRGAFWDCLSLVSVTIFNGVSSIGDHAFMNCFSLTSVTIPASVTSIEREAFYSCRSLTDVYYSGSKADWNAISIGSLNDPLLNATIHYSGSGTVTGGPAHSAGPFEATPYPETSPTPKPGPTDGRLDSSEGAQVSVSQVLQTGQTDDFAFYYATFEDAVAFFNEGTNAPVIFKLLTDCTCDSISLIGIGFGATIDLAGHTLSLGKMISACPLEICDTVGDGCINISQYGELTAQNELKISSGTVSGSISIEQHSKFTLSGGHIFGPIEVNATPDNFVITGGTISDITENGQPWSLTSKVLTISGTGAIPDYESHLDVPWDYLTSNSWYVESIVVKDGITRIGDRAFAFFGGKTLTLPNTVSTLGAYSISFTALNTNLEIPSSVTRIEAGAFDSTENLEVKFLGSAPEFKDTSDIGTSPVFDRSSNITILYPAGDESWTPHVGKSLGAKSIEWKSYGKTAQTATIHISANPASGGQVRFENASGTSAAYKKGDSATVVATADSGYRFVRWTENGSTVSTSATYTFTVEANRTLTALFERTSSDGAVTSSTSSSPFSDIAPSVYYYEAVQWAVSMGIAGGYDDGSFRPNATCTRAQIVTFLWRANGSPEPSSTRSFADVSANAYFAKAVQWALEQGITTGATDVTFNPDGGCTRAQAMTFLWRANGSPSVSGGSFSDVPSGKYYADAIAWAAANGVSTGYAGGTFAPNNTCTRGNIITFLYRDMVG